MFALHLFRVTERRMHAYPLHWLENKGTIPAVEISVDVVRKEEVRGH